MCLVLAVIILVAAYLDLRSNAMATLTDIQQQVSQINVNLNALKEQVDTFKAGASQPIDLTSVSDGLTQTASLIATISESLQS